MSRLQDVIQRGTRAAQPAATAVSIGALYYVTDEKIMERSTGAAWQAVMEALTGDSGSGGTKGLVPAPAAGDAAAGKFLKASGAWATPASGSGSFTEVVKASSDTVTNSGTMVSDSELTFATSAGVYEVEFAIWYEGTTAATNFKWSIDFPTLADLTLFVGTYTCYTTGLSVQETPGAAGTTTRWPSGGTGTQIGVPIANQKIPFFGRFVFTSSGVGTVVFKFAQGSASPGNSVIVRPGSCFRYRKWA